MNQLATTGQSGINASTSKQTAEALTFDPDQKIIITPIASVDETGRGRSILGTTLYIRKDLMEGITEEALQGDKSIGSGDALSMSHPYQGEYYEIEMRKHPGSKGSGNGYTYTPQAMRETLTGWIQSVISTINNSKAEALTFDPDQKIIITPIAQVDETGRGRSILGTTLYIRKDLMEGITEEALQGDKSIGSGDALSMSHPYQGEYYEIEMRKHPGSKGSGNGYTYTPQAMRETLTEWIQSVTSTINRSENLKIASPADNWSKGLLYPEGDSKI